MEVSAFFLSLMLILVVARLFGELSARLQVPPVMGEILAGIMLGPSILGWIEPNDIIKLLAEIGIILLLFEVGLETDFSRLAKAGGKAGVVALGGFIAPFLGGYATAYWLFGLSPLVALFIGGTLTATSIGVTVRVLRDLHRQTSHEAQIVLGAAVLDDILGVVLLALLFEFATGGGVQLINAGKIMIFIVVFLILAPIVAKFFAGVVRQLDKESQISGLIPTSIVSLVLFFAWLAHAIGAPELLGGFAAGLALSKRFFLPFGAPLTQTDGHFIQRIEGKMKPIIHVFTPIFFVMVGLSLNLHEIDWHSPLLWLMSVSFVLLAIITKFSGAFLIHEPWNRRIIIGTAMVPRAEVGLIFAEIGRTSAVFNDEIYAVMILTIAITTILPSFMLKSFYSRYDSIPDPYVKKK
jgi:Kef-type K+ transport system membrane component KefB